MSKRIGITVILLLFLFALSAQKKMNYIEVDKKSYGLYEQQKWSELIEFSMEARKQGIDYFYLQARTGIAYYNLKKYRTSAKWFLKAWENDQSLEWLQEYLYYSLIYSGRSSEAIKYAADFTDSLKKKISFAENKVTRIALESGFSFNPDFEKLQNQPLAEKANVGDNYGEAYFLKNYYFTSFDFSHQVNPGFSLNHNLTYINVNREEVVDWGYQSSFPIKINQFQYFINPNFLVGEKLNISPSLNVVWGKSEVVLGGLQTDSNPYFYNSELKYSDLIFSTAIWSHLGNFSPGAEINFANIYDKTFSQLSAWVTVYPLSNANLYFTPQVYFKSGTEGDFGYNTFGISGGAQLGPLHLYGQYLSGEMENFIESAGYLVANFPGRSSSKFSGSIYFPIGKNIQFVVRYINQNVIESYNVYENGIKINSVEYDEYFKHTLTGGISWNF